MARTKNVRNLLKRAKRKETKIAPPAYNKPETKKNDVRRDYEFEDGDDQMWHAQWCLDSWNKPGSKTLLLFQWKCQDEPTWEPFEGHNEDSCLAADFFHWLPDRPRPTGWKPPVGWEVPETRPPIEWFKAEEAARENWPQLWEPKTLEAKLRILEPKSRSQETKSRCQASKRGRQRKAHSRARSNATIKAHGAKKKPVHDSSRKSTSNSALLDSEKGLSFAELESKWARREARRRKP
ncbi:hypothetical protein IWZ03DRAFT_359566 [Phyllosticta citriasiana]|uniref:Chromo domain-containing protein n=1 Tax=Phyllosticta citriasiana TaxID=595635 RepID=A0ABR1KP30_9PEZI